MLVCLRRSRLRQRVIAGIVRCVSSELKQLIQRVRSGVHVVVPSAYVRRGDTWSRSRAGIYQAFRLSRYRVYSDRYVTLNLYADARLVDFPIVRLRPDVRLSTQYPDIVGGANFFPDDDEERFQKRLAHVVEEIPAFADFFDRVWDQDHFLDAMPDGIHITKLLAYQTFGRRAELAEGLERLPWSPRPDLWSADWYGNLELAEQVLQAYEYLGIRPSPRWREMAEYTLASIGGRPRKANADQHTHVVTMIGRLR